MFLCSRSMMLPRSCVPIGVSTANYSLSGDWSSYDTNNDELISLDELKAALQSAGGTPMFACW